MLSTSVAISSTLGSGWRIMRSFLASLRLSRSILYEPLTFAYSAGSGKRSFCILVTYSTSTSGIILSRFDFSVTGMRVFIVWRTSLRIFSVSGETKYSSTLYSESA